MTQTTSNTLLHLTEEERRLLELAEQATRGPWSVRNNHGAIDITAKARRICKMIYHEGSEDCEVDTNAAYIAAACNSIPALLTTIGQLRGELEGVKLERDEAVTLIRAYTHCNNAVYSCSVCPFRGIEDDCQVRWETDMRRITEKTESEASE